MKRSFKRVIQDTLGVDELLTQLAEEAAELSQAALKLRRAYTGTNPTPVSAQDAYEGLMEEVADVGNCIAVLGFDRTSDKMCVRRIASKKMERWAARLEGVSER